MDSVWCCAHFVLSCTKIFMLASESLVMSLSRYSDSFSVAISKSRWFSWRRGEGRGTLTA